MKNSIQGEPKNIYLVVNPAGKGMIDKLKEALTAGIDILQIWNYWPKGITSAGKLELIRDIKQLSASFAVPVLINEDWQLMIDADLDGVHFDHIPENWDDIRGKSKRKFIAGLTCGNDEERIEWAAVNKMDYISFCSMFPSTSVDSCEIVHPASVKKARKLTSLPIYLSGGINPNNIRDLLQLEFNGIALISGIMNAESPGKKVLEYRQALAENNNDKNITTSKI